MSYQIVHIKWEDSVQPTHGWTWVDEIKDSKPTQCESVGFLLEDNGDAVMLSSNVGDLDRERHQVMGVITIPRRAIISMTKLKTDTEDTKKRLVEVIKTITEPSPILEGLPFIPQPDSLFRTSLEGHIGTVGQGIMMNGGASNAPLVASVRAVMPTDDEIPF